MTDLAQYVQPPTTTDVLEHLGWSSSTRNVALASAHLGHVEALVRAYTRGVGFYDLGTIHVVKPDVRAVIIGACARSVSNPANAYRVEAGSVVATPARFEGFTLAEQAALNRYRVRVA